MAIESEWDTVPTLSRMNLPSGRHGRIPRGLTLLELTVVISVLLSLASLLTTGARAWKRGADRAECLMSLRSIQVAVRSYQNINNFDAGAFHPTKNGTADIGEHVFNAGLISSSLHELATGARQCPGGGTYSCAEPTRFPEVGQPYLACSLAADPDAHRPTSSNW